MNWLFDGLDRFDYWYSTRRVRRHGNAVRKQDKVEASAAYRSGDAEPLTARRSQAHRETRQR